MSIIFLWHTIGPLFTCVVHFFPYFTLSLSGPRFLFALFSRAVWKIAGVFECFFNYFLQYRRFIWRTMLIANITSFLLANLIWTRFVWKFVFFSFSSESRYYWVTYFYLHVIIVVVIILLRNHNCNYEALSKKNKISTLTIEHITQNLVQKIFGTFWCIEVFENLTRIRPHIKKSLPILWEWII